jgi:ubiquinone/menaquinone biosynthesis C-methylase UbiE
MRTSGIHSSSSPASWLLDVGCGTGGDVRALAELVGPRGQVVGIDSSEVMIAEARSRSAVAGLATEFRVGDAHHLRFGMTRSMAVGPTGSCGMSKIRVRP